MTTFVAEPQEDVEEEAFPAPPEEMGNDDWVRAAYLQEAGIAFGD